MDLFLLNVVIKRDDISFENSKFSPGNFLRQLQFSHLRNYRFRIFRLTSQYLYQGGVRARVVKSVSGVFLGVHLLIGPSHIS